THGSDRVGTTLSRMNELGRVRESISMDLVDLLVQLGQGLVYLCMMFFYGWQLGFIVLAVGPLAYLTIRVGGDRLRRLCKKVFEQSTRGQSEVTEQIESIATIKAVSGEQQARGRWERTFVEGVDLQRSMLHTSAAIQAVFSVLQEVARYAALYFAVRMV